MAYSVQGSRFLQGVATAISIPNDIVPPEQGAQFSEVEAAQRAARTIYRSLTAFYRFDIVDSHGVAVERCHPEGGVWTWVKAIS